ncbi:hypothetical protein ACFP3Q_15230 [Nocardioides sp. GCM10027113]|uniref:hypothetical protein n=1 Tax=unclassified Nocardioides TaxID=2615069 RepID=UPI0036067CE3
MDPEQFDAFYKDARARLLLQTYALTGDMPASRSAVRDAFVAAWHHWRKVQNHPDPESWVRPHAWSHAQRRHTARIWHRDKNLDGEARATLEALGKLPVAQRKALLLTHLATVSMERLAREVGLPRAEAERELQTASAQFAVHRDVATTQIRSLFEPLRELADQASWPRATIIRRAGQARRRTHTLVGAGIGMAAVLVSGVLVTDASGVRPTLEGTAAEVAAAVDDQPAAQPPPEPAEQFTADALLTAQQVGNRVPGRGWAEAGTTDNTEGDGLVMPCQQDRFADPRGRATWVRTFEGRAPSGKGETRAVHTAELSAKPRAAERAFDNAVDWFAGCAEPRVQLLATREVKGVGDEATLVVLRDWNGPGATYVAAVARTGLITTVTMSRTAPDAAPEPPSAARLLAGAVDGLCDQPDAGRCTTEVQVLSRPPVPVGNVPGMLSEVDLPPVANVGKPWVGTEARKAVSNVAATGCDKTSFSDGGISNNLTRTFVIPDAKLPDEFGLTQSVGTLPAGKARSFVAGIRDKMAGCGEEDLGTDVTRVAHTEGADADLSVWHVKTEISDDQTVSYLMGVARQGTAVTQVGFVPAGDVTMAPGAFIDLVQRASGRLPAMPKPR